LGSRGVGGGRGRGKRGVVDCGYGRCMASALFHALGLDCFKIGGIS
jgi:hypothetical protein